MTRSSLRGNVALPQVNRIDGLTALRGLAIGLVIAHHAWPSFLPGGGLVGVVVFFALSGYLITGLLLNDIERFGRIRYCRFYSHRIVRLVPALALMLAIFCIAAVISGVSNYHLLAMTLGTAIVYLSDLLPYSGYAGLGHLWTLAIEEQFYFIWPFVLIIAAKTGKLGIALIWATAVSWLAATAATIAFGHFREVGNVYTLPTSWSVTLVLGGVAHYVQRNRRHTRIFMIIERNRYVCAAPSTFVIIALSLEPDIKDRASTYVIGGPLIAASTCALIYFFVRDLPVKTIRPFVWLGEISYAAYLWNTPVNHWLGNDGGRLYPAKAALSIPATLALACLSTYVVERPLQRKFRKRNDRIAPDHVSPDQAPRDNKNYGLRPNVEAPATSEEKQQGHGPS